MNIVTTFFRHLFGNSTSQRKGVQDGTPATSAHEGIASVGIDSALQISTVWACVTLIVENIASLPLVVFSKDKDGRRIVDIDDPTYKVFKDTPNPRQTSMEFWTYMLLNYVLRGNAYAIIKRRPNGTVISLWPLAADQVDVFETEDKSLLYRYNYNNEYEYFKADQILHIRGMGNGIYGMSPLDYMRASVGLSINAQNHTHKTFTKGARRPGLLMTDRVMNEEQRKAVKKNFGDIASGGGNELYILESQFKFEPLGMSPADIQLLETRKFTVQDLARWFGVPSVLVNDTAETTSLGSSVEQIIDGFHKLKLRPMLELIEQAIENRVFTLPERSKGKYIEFNLDALLRSSLSERMDVYSTGVQNGIYTRNDCRARENLDPMEGGDILTAQSNLLPLDKLGTQTNTGGNVPPDTVRQ